MPAHDQQHAATPDAAKTFGVNEVLTSLVSIQGAIREAWRLTNQAQDATNGRKPVLPEYMLATPESANKGIQALRRMLSSMSDGAIQDLLTLAPVKRAYGELDQWLFPVGDHAATRWADLAANLSVLRDIGNGQDVPLVSPLWEKLGRTVVNATTAIRTAEAIQFAQQAGMLPENARLRIGAPEDFERSGNFVPYRLVTAEEGRPLDGHVHPDIKSAVDAATYIHLSNQPFGALTLDQFAKITEVIHVQDGRGRTGTAKNGPVRWLLSDSASQEQLRKVIARSYDLLYSEPLAEEAIPPREAWITKRLSEMLCAHQPGQCVSTRVTADDGRGVGHLLFVVAPFYLQPRSSALRQTLAHIHEHYVAKLEAQHPAQNPRTAPRN